MSDLSSTIYIKTNFDCCSGCGLCLLACSEHLLGGYNPHRALLHVRHTAENLYHFPTVCNQCENAYCANVCPVKAIGRDSITGAVIVDHDKCIGCGMCQRYCPIHMIKVDPDIHKAVKCDLCSGSPACIAACPTGALALAGRYQACAATEGEVHGD